MLIVYDSKTGNVERFIHKLGLPAVKVSEGLTVDEPFTLVTYTTGFGQVPESTTEFLAKNHGMLRGVASSGNRNWGDFFGKAAYTISEAFKVPLIYTFELSGTPTDVETFKRRVVEL